MWTGLSATIPRSSASTVPDFMSGAIVNVPDWPIQKI